MPNLIDCGSNEQWILPGGQDHPWVEDLQLAEQAGSSQSENTEALSTRRRAAGRPEAALELLKSDFFEDDDQRFCLTEDRQNTNCFINLAGRIANRYVYSSLKKQLVPADWTEARTNRQLVSKDSSGGYFYGIALNHCDTRDEIVSHYDGKVPLISAVSACTALICPKENRRACLECCESGSSDVLEISLCGWQFLYSYTATTCPQMWYGMLRSRRALSSKPKIRSVYDIAFAGNEVLSRVSGPVNNFYKSSPSPILVGTNAYKYAEMCHRAALDLDVVGADLSTYDKSFSSPTCQD